MTKEDHAIILQIFSELGEELALDVIKHRKALRCELTPRGAKALMREYIASGDAVRAAEHHLNMGWRGYSATWIKGGFTDSHNPSKAETPQQRIQRMDLQNQYRFARDEGQKDKAEKLRAQLGMFTH